MYPSGFKTSKTRFYKQPAAAKVLLGLSNIEGKVKTISERCENLSNSENLEVPLKSEISENVENYQTRIILKI